MINPSFYIKDRTIGKFLGGKLPHYPIRERAKVIQHTLYVVQSGDTLYSIASRLFGPDSEYNWTIIAEINYLRTPEELVVGEIIKLPLTILSETLNRLPRYEQNTSTAIKI